MAQGQATDPVVAAQVAGLHDTGYTVSAAARAVGLPVSTANDIVNRHGRWGEIAALPVFNRLRQEQNRTIEALARKMAADSFVMAAEKMKDASYYQLVIGGSTLIDKAQLLAGLPTSITEHVNYDKLEALRAKLDEIAQRREEMKSREIDVTPGKTG